MSSQTFHPNESSHNTQTNERPNDNHTQPWRPLVAPSPYQQIHAQQPQQPADSYFPLQPNPLPQYNGTPPVKMQQQSYQQQGQANGIDGLAQQMDQVGLDGAPQQQQHARRKKDRHAYHQLDQSQPAPQFSTPVPADGQSQSWMQTSQPWRSQSLGPSAPSQVPAQAGTPISMDGQRGGPQGAAAGLGGAPSKVNPDQAPSVPLSRDLPAEHYKNHVYPSMEQRLPPPAITPFVAYDQGNASPKFARLTVNSIPNSHEQLHQTGIPLGLFLQPLAKRTDGEQAIPVLDFGDIGPPRCRRCRAYINPFMVFSNGGNRMTCNLCGHPNEVPPEYFAPTDPSGLRVDRQQRPELTLGTCEFLVPREYWAKEPVPIRYLFLVDVSAEACSRGFLQGVCDGILAALYGDDVDAGDGSDQTNGDVTKDKSAKPPPEARVGIMTFDREIHFFNVSSSLSAPQDLVVSDLDDPFAAMSPEHLFVDPLECKSNIRSLLRLIPNMFGNIKHPEPTLLPSLIAALSALMGTGGKVICSLASLPSYGPGKLFPRDKGHPPAEDSEAARNLLKTDYPGYKKLQADLVKAGVGVDFFLAAPSGGYLDLATIGLVAERTGGETFYYPNWAYPRDLLRLRKEFSHAVQREQGYAALMKVRCSNGLQVAQYSGNFTQHTFGADLELATVTEDSGMCVTFTYDGKLDTKLDAHFQSALLYTTATGQRRVRCSNVVATVTDSARDTMRLVDQDAVVSILAKEAASKLPERPIKDVRDGLQDKTVQILAGYRKHFSGTHPSGQLVLPENLKEFAMYILGLLKSRALKGGREPSDRRIHDIRLIKGMGLADLSLYLYPRIIPLHTLESDQGFADEDGHLKMPRAVRASFGMIEEGGAYLVDNGQTLLLWLHAQVSPNLLEDLFGAGYDSLHALDPNLSALPILETHLNAQVRNILTHLEQCRGSKGLAIQLARQNLDGAEFEFARLLYEDRNGEASSYVDWLVMLHRGVGMELSGQRSKASGEDVSQTISNTISSITGGVPYWG